LAVVLPSVNTNITHQKLFKYVIQVSNSLFNYKYYNFLVLACGFFRNLVVKSK